MRVTVIVLLLCSASFSPLAMAGEKKLNANGWLFEGKVHILSKNYENDVTFFGVQLSRKGTRHAIGAEISSNFSKVNDRGNSSYEHIQFLGGAFISSSLWKSGIAKLKGELAAGLAIASRQSVDFDDIDVVEPATSVYFEPRIVMQFHRKNLRLKPSVGIGYIGYAASDGDFSAVRIHLGFSF